MNFDLIVKKIMSVMKFTDEKEVAKLFELSPPDFSARKKRGSILPFIVSWGINEGVNLDWLLKEGQTGVVSEDEPCILAQVIVDTVRVMQTLDEHDQKEVLKYAKERKALEGIKLF